jgi:small-conductance mechanosensitive channel
VAQVGEPARAITTIEPISAHNIPSRADADEQFAQDVLRGAALPDPLHSFGQQLDELEVGVTTLGARMRDEQLHLLPRLRLESLRRNWQFFDKQLGLWRRDSQRQLDRYSEDAAQLASRRADWRATRQTARTSAVAPALLERVDDVLRQLDAADRVVSAPLAEQLELGRRGNVVQSSIEAGLQAVDAASDNFDRRLSVTDSPSLWRAWRDPQFSRTNLPAATTGLVVDRDFLRRYVTASSEKLWVHGAFALLALPVLIWLRNRSQKLIADEPEKRSSTQALLRPISSWLVLVLVATLFFEADAPPLLHEAALLVAVIPVLRLLPKEVFDVLGPWPYAVTALYVFQRLGFVLVAHPLWYRVHLLAVTLLTLAVLLWIVLQARRRVSRSNATSIQKAARTVGWLGVLVLVVSAAANLLGNVTLSELLTRGTLDSGYLGLVLYAGAAVLGSIAKLLLARRDVSRLKMVTQHTGPLLATFAKLITYAALAVWVLITLDAFRVLRPIVGWARGVLTYPIGYGAISLTLGSILLFAISVYVAFWIARTLRTILQDEVLGRMSLPRGVANSVSSLTYYAVILLGLLVALVATGFQVSQLAIVVGALGVGIGFGLQNVVNNFVSGLILMFERPIQPGDVVEITGTSGTVREIGMRATTLTTGEGADVVVPNGTLLSEKLINWTLSDTNRRLDVDVGVAYGSDPKQVLELLKNVALSTPGVAAQPEPVVLLTQFGPNSLDFGIRAWTNEFGNWGIIRSNIAVRVHDALKEAGIEIPFPQQDVHIRSVPKEVAPAAAVERSSGPV